MIYCEMIVRVKYWNEKNKTSYKNFKKTLYTHKIRVFISILVLLEAGKIEKTCLIMIWMMITPSTSVGRSDACTIKTFSANRKLPAFMTKLYGNSNIINSMHLKRIPFHWNDYISFWFWEEKFWFGAFFVFFFSSFSCVKRDERH